ncbi:MAG: HAD family hydrolase [Sphaerochaeta sp.]
MKLKRAAIFDLDGTILDTTKDIGLALDKTLGTVFTDEQVKRFVGQGLRNSLIAGAKELGLENYDIDELDRKLLENYRQIPVLHTKPFPGVVRLLLTLTERGIPICVYTNKEEDIALSVLRLSLPEIRLSMVAGTHGKFDMKPSSQAIDAFCLQENIPKEDTLYIGDSEIDFKTALQAEMDYRILTWGSRSKETLLKAGVPEECLIPNLDGIENLFILKKLPGNSGSF